MKFGKRELEPNYIPPPPEGERNIHINLNIMLVGVMDNDKKLESTISKICELSKAFPNIRLHVNISTNR